MQLSSVCFGMVGGLMVVGCFHSVGGMRVLSFFHSTFLAQHNLIVLGMN